MFTMTVSWLRNDAAIWHKSADIIYWRVDNTDGEVWRWVPLMWPSKPCSRIPGLYVCTFRPQTVEYSPSVMYSVHRCLHNKAPQYLVDCCVPVSDIDSRQRLRSASRCQLTVPRHRRSTFGRRAFSVAGPTVWNLLPDQVKNSGCTELTFGRTLETFFFDQY